jgi:hypothetical protein
MAFGSIWLASKSAVDVGREAALSGVLARLLENRAHFVMGVAFEHLDREAR